jgi:hypothetical protein
LPSQPKQLQQGAFFLLACILPHPSQAFDLFTPGGRTIYVSERLTTFNGFKWFHIKLGLTSTTRIQHQHKMKKESNGNLQKADEYTTNELRKNLNKNTTYEMEFPNVRGVVNNLDYHVYYYPRPAQPLYLGNPILVC